MKVCVCRFCGVTFKDNIHKSVCKACEEKENTEFERIEKYLLRFPNSNALQIADGLDISPFDVLRYIEEGRLCINKGTFEAYKND